jgi:hypothetical protein
MWSLLFCTIGAAGLYAVLGPAAGPDAPKGTAIFLAALFIPMGLAPLPFAASMKTRVNVRASMRTGQATQLADALGRMAAQPAASRPRPPVPDPEPDGDPLEKIEKLGELRDKGLITEAEFQIQKARLLRDV